MAPTSQSTRSVPILKTASDNIIKALSYKRPPGNPGGRLYLNKAGTLYVKTKRED
jgi:hypothetical protein